MVTDRLCQISAQGSCLTDNAFWVSVGILELSLVFHMWRIWHVTSSTLLMKMICYYWDCWFFGRRLRNSSHMIAWPSWVLFHSERILRLHSHVFYNFSTGVCVCMCVCIYEVTPKSKWEMWFKDAYFDVKFQNPVFYGIQSHEFFEDSRCIHSFKYACIYSSSEVSMFWHQKSTYIYVCVCKIYVYFSFWLMYWQERLTKRLVFHTLLPCLCVCWARLGQAAGRRWQQLVGLPWWWRRPGYWSLHLLPAVVRISRKLEWRV